MNKSGDVTGRPAGLTVVNIERGIEMSATQLRCLAGRHGLSFETRAGIYEITIDLHGTIVRTVNCQQLASFDPNSRTGQRLEQLFEKYRGELEDLNAAGLLLDATEHRRIYWDVRNGLKGD